MGPLFALVAALMVATAHAQYTDTNAGAYPGTRPNQPRYASQPGLRSSQASNPTHGQPTLSTYGQPSQPIYGQDKRSQSTYGQPRPTIHHPPRNLLPDIAAVRARVSALIMTDKMTNTRLDGLKGKIDKVKEFRADFSDNILPAEEARVKEEETRIASAADQLKDHAALADDVAALTARVNNFVSALRRAREMYNSINADINDLIGTERDQQYDISNVWAKAEEQVIRLIAGDEAVTTNENFANSLYDPLTSAVDIINAERSETFNLVLQGTPVTYTFATPFTRIPYISAVMGGSFAEDIVPGQSIQISGHVEITNVTTDEVTIDFPLSLNGAPVDIPHKIFVTVTAYIIDNTEIEYLGIASTTDSDGTANDYVWNHNQQPVYRSATGDH